MITDTTFREPVFERIRSQLYEVAACDTGPTWSFGVGETQSVGVPAVAQRLLGQPLVVAQTTSGIRLALFVKVEVSIRDLGRRSRSGR